MMTSLRRPPRRCAAPAGLVRACCPAPAADLRRAQRFTRIPLAEFGLPQSEKMFGHDGGRLKKKSGYSGYFTTFRCFVWQRSSPTAWTAMVNAHVRALANTLYVILRTTVSNSQHSLERECREETRVSFSHYR